MQLPKIFGERALSVRPLAYAGQISFGLYVYHMLDSLLADRWLPDLARWMIDIPTVRLFTLGTGTLLFASVSWSLLEQPINRFRGAKPRRLPGAERTACLPLPFKAAA